MAPPTPVSSSSAPMKGVLYMIVGSALLTANDTVLKWLSGSYPVGQLMCLRGIFVYIPIAYFVWKAGGVSALRISKIRGQGLRAALVVCGTFMFVTGLFYLPIADAIAISFAGPLFVTALAPWLLGERIGWRRWVAVFIGFGGVLIITRPTSEAVQWAAFLPLTASFTGALRDILTRRLAFQDSSAATLTITTSAVVLAGAASYFFVPWQPVKSTDIGLFALGGVLIGCAHYALIETFRHAEAALVTPFKYSSIIWAAALGYVIWGDIPDVWTVLGVIILVVSGLYILRREVIHRQIR
jgi:drug/metabolite transporter (DMT)-like permease